MAAYFTAPRLHAPPVPSSPEQQLSRNSDDSFDAAEGAPTYVFPNPSSAPPSPSPSHFSILSEHSDITASLVSFSEFGSPEISPVVPQREYYPAHPTSRQFGNALVSHLNSWADAQEPSLNPRKTHFGGFITHDAHNKASHHPHGKGPNGETTSISIPELTSATTDTKFSHPLIRSSVCSRSLVFDEEKTESVMQQRRFLFRKPTPFFSFISSLLNVDQSTLDLFAEPTSSASIIFSLDARHRTTTWDGTDAFPAPHGFDKLFSTVTAEKGHQNMHQVVEFFNDISFSEVNPVPIPGIWVVVTGILSSGCKFLNRLSSNLARRITETN